MAATIQNTPGYAQKVQRLADMIQTINQRYANHPAYRNKSMEELLDDPVYSSEIRNAVNSVFGPISGENLTRVLEDVGRQTPTAAASTSQATNAGNHTDASGSPTAPTAPPGQSFGQAVNMVASVNGLLQMINPVNIAINAIPVLATSLGMVGVVGAGYGLFSSGFMLGRNGFSWGGLAQIGMGLFGMASGFAGIAAAQMGISMWTVMPMILSNPVFWLIGGGIILTGLLIGLFGPKKSDQEKSMENLVERTIWHPGRIVAGTTAVVAVLAGIGVHFQNAGEPVRTVTVSTSLLRRHLPPNLTTIQGEPLKPGEIPYDTPVAIVGADGRVSRVMIISKYSGTQDSIRMYDLNKDYVFAAPKSPDHYIPFFIGKEVNPEAQMSIRTQQHLLTSILQGALEPAQALRALMLASAANKEGVEAIPVDPR